jgi:type II secretory pathway pseudopilin PulG
MRGAEDGFSLIDVLLATALFAVLALGAFESVRLLTASARTTAAAHAAYAGLERFAAQLRAEARGASAIWTSSPAAGAGADDCVQFDFYAADAAGPEFWSYRQFPNHPSAATPPGDAVQRVAARAPIAACDPALPATTVLTALRAPLAVTTVVPGALASHRDPYTGGADSAFVAGGVPAGAPIPLGVLDAAGAPLAGGNALVEVGLATAVASRTLDLVPGVFPNGFTEVLRYTCSARCDAGHDTAAPKTLTTCALTWQPGWSTFVAWPDAVAQPDGTLRFPGGWFIGGTFVFTYAGTRASDGGTDSLAKPYAASNWDPARDYAAFPPDRAAPDGSQSGSFAPWDVRAESPAAWLGDFTPYLAAGEGAAIAAEQARCDAVRAQGAAGGFYANG